MWKSLPPLFKGKHHRICQHGSHEGREPRQKFYMEALKKEELTGEWAAGIKPPVGPLVGTTNGRRSFTALWDPTRATLEEGSHHPTWVVRSSFKQSLLFLSPRKSIKNHKKLDWMVLADSHTTEGSFSWLQPAQGSPQMLPSSRRQHFRVQEKAAAAQLKTVGFPHPFYQVAVWLPAPFKAVSKLLFKRYSSFSNSEERHRSRKQLVT